RQPCPWPRACGSARSRPGHAARAAGTRRARPRASHRVGLLGWLLLGRGGLSAVRPGVGGGLRGRRLLLGHFRLDRRAGRLRPLLCGLLVRLAARHEDLPSPSTTSASTTSPSPSGPAPSPAPFDAAADSAWA